MPYYNKQSKDMTMEMLLLFHLRDLATLSISVENADAIQAPNTVTNFEHGVEYLETLMHPFLTKEYMRLRNNVIERLGKTEWKHYKKRFVLLQEWLSLIVVILNNNMIVNFNATARDWEDENDEEEEE